MLMRKIIFQILFLLIPFSYSWGQASGRIKNNPRYDRKPLHFGFSIGANYFDFRHRYVANLSTEVPGYYRMESTVAPGYSIAIITNLRLGNHWDLRFNPGFASTVRSLEFDVVNQFTQRRETQSRQIESSFMEFPLHLKFKSERIGNYRLYVLGGPKYALDLASDEDVQDDRVFKLQQDDFSYDLGFGVDIYFEYFKFSPQIIYSFGLTNMKVNDDTFLVEGLQSLNTRALLINFTFE